MGDEAAIALRNSIASDHVVTLGDLTEHEKTWLYERAALSLYPTNSEGFGLIPFESALRRVPFLSTRQGSLDEVLPADILTLDGFDLSSATDRAWSLLHDDDVRRSQCQAMALQAKQFTWQRTAEELVELFQEVLRRPPTRVVSVWGEGPAPTSLETDVPRTERRLAAATERQIQRLLQAEGLKRAVAPEGSRRQNTARGSANWLRRTARRI
jgi:hypothetical protein